MVPRNSNVVVVVLVLVRILSSLTLLSFGLNGEIFTCSCAFTFTFTPQQGRPQISTGSSSSSTSSFSMPIQLQTSHWNPNTDFTLRHSRRHGHGHGHGHGRGQSLQSAAGAGIGANTGTGTGTGTGAAAANGGAEGEGLTIDKISILLELTFIEACLQIATGYVDVLKLFLATLKAAYDQRIPIPTLVDAVATADVERNSANRPLTSEEINLRTLWMNLSYLTLEYLHRIESRGNDGSDLAFDSNIDEALQESLSVSISTRGTYKYIVEEKVLQFLGRGSNNNNNNNNNIDQNAVMGMDDTAQAAMMMYSLKIIDLILVVVKEERVANDSGGLDGNGIGPPRPNIPGAF